MTDEDKPEIGSLDHIGWRLWQAAQVWKIRFTEGMLAEGYAWYAEARSSVVPYIGPDGIRQSDLVRRMGLTKQAVQQLVDDLVKAGIVERSPDPSDRRGKIVRFTSAGIAAQRDADKIKVMIETEMRETLGAEDFDRLYALLRRLIDADESNPGPR